jgi:hypothetical protein
LVWKLASQTEAILLWWNEDGPLHERARFVWWILPLRRRNSRATPASERIDGGIDERLIETMCMLKSWARCI